jgi:hypothetical protein
MSAAMDDFGISGALNTLQPDYSLEQVKPGTTEKVNTEQVSGSGQTQPEINDVFVKNSSVDKSTLEKLQNDYTALSEQGQQLDQIDEMLTQTGGADLSSNQVNEINSTLDQVVPQDNKPAARDQNTVAADQNAIEQDQKVVAEDQKAVAAEQKAADDKKNTDGNAQAADSAKEVSQLKAKIAEKQQEIAKLQKELYHKVSSVVEISIGKEEDTGKTIEQQAEDLKTSVSKDIKDNPTQSVKMQITQFDDKLLLAMLSLRG